MSETPDSTPEDEAHGLRRGPDRRRLIDLTRRDKGLPERRNLGIDRRRTGDELLAEAAPDDAEEGETSS